jgi:D-amino-acid dehydrogenase
VGAALKRPPAAGIVFTGTGQVSEPQAVRDALREAFMARGGNFVMGTVTSVTTNESSVTALLDSGGALTAEAALIAAGAWSRPLMKGLGIDVPLIGERGYSLQSAEHRWPVTLPPVVFEECAMVVTRFTGGLRCSSFVEFGDPDGPPDSAKWDRLARHLRDLGIAFSPTPISWCGPRPTLPDYLPAIGRMESRPRILYAFGHQHLGLTLASVTAELIESLATWTAPRMNIAPFRVERFA